MRYVSARFRVYQREEAYRIYTTDTQKLIVDALLSLGGGDGIPQRYVELFNNTVPTPTESPETIVDRIKRKAVVSE